MAIKDATDIKKKAAYFSKTAEKITRVRPARIKKRIPKKDFVDTYDLPSYNSTNLTLIARGPHQIHAYWDIAHSSAEALKSRIGAGAERAMYTLRMYDVTFINFDGKNANHWFDLDFDPGMTNNWYINLWRDNASFCGEIGLRLSDGRFFPFTMSNVVMTPRNEPSGRSDEIWMKVDNDSSRAPFVVVETKGSNNHRNGSPAASLQRRRIYLSEGDIRAYYSKISPLLRDVLAGRLANLGKTYGPVIRRNGGFLDELLRRGLTKGQFLKRIILGASEELALTGGASGAMGASEIGASERMDVKRKFFFEIGTDIIVYGRTEPGASVHLGEKEIPIRPDGTFSMRFALPDNSAIPFDFTARSKDKMEKRRIETGVLRKLTKYE